VFVSLAVGLVCGPVVGFVGLVLWALARSHGADLLLLVVVLLLGLGVGSGRALVALRSDELSTGVHEDTRALFPLAAAAVAVVAGFAFWALTRTDVGLSLLAGCVVTGMVMLVVGAGLRSEGLVDTRTGVLEYGGTTVPVGAVRRIRSVQVGRLVFAVVGYHAGRTGPSTPRFLVLPADGLAAVERARTSTFDADDPAPDPDAHTVSSAVRAVATMFGLACLAAGPVLWLALPPGGRFVAAYLGVFGLLFGALFLRYAAA
jgi:hypothetical protein